jgi:putative flippase GtrA
VPETVDRPPFLSWAKAGKYISASLAGVAVGQSTLFFFSAVLDWKPELANLMAATFGAIPNYLINRYWTWNKRSKNHLTREVLPFWVLSIAGLLISTVFVGVAEDRWPDSQLAIQAANLSGYGVLWVLKFLVLEHLLFKPVTTGDLVSEQSDIWTDD